MSLDFSTTTGINIGGTSYLALQNLGSVSMPTQPCFYAYNANATTPGNVVIFANVAFNIGSCYNSSNGRFTAPLAGVYYFRYKQLAASASAGEYRVALYVNGAAYGGLRYIHQQTANTWNHLIASGHVYMNAGDYVNVMFESAADSLALYNSSGWDNFTGHFVG